MKFKPYPKYKASGVEWLGDIPLGWRISKLGYESWVRARLGWKGLKADEYVDDGFIMLATPNLKGSEIDFENVNYISKERFDESPEIQLNRGDVLLVKDGSTLGTVSFVNRLPRPATVNGSIAVLSSHGDIAGRYLYYLLSSTFIQATIEQLKGGMGVPHLFQSDLRKFTIPIPPGNDQQQIAQFLDRQLIRIDRLVSQQQTIVDTLLEKRQALISHAVTKGLNPNVPMKDSGIEWLGKVPQHWTVIPLKRDLAFVTSGSRGWAEYFSDDGSVFLTIRNLTRDSIYLDLSEVQHVQPPAGAEGERTRVRENDLLISITADLGSVALADAALDRAYVSQHVALARLAGELLEPKWVAYVVLSTVGHTHFDLQAYGGTKIQLSLDDLRTLPVLVPPRYEQIQIVHELEAKLQRIDALLKNAEGAIELLQEHRSALISAAVTGKIDVRNVDHGDLSAEQRQSYATV